MDGLGDKMNTRFSDRVRMGGFNRSAQRSRRASLLVLNTLNRIAEPRLLLRVLSLPRSRH